MKILNLPAHQKGILALVVANIIWGAASPIFKFALENIPLFTLAFIRFYFASIILLIIAYPKLKIKSKDYLKILLISLTGIFLHISFYFLGLRLAPSINAPVISASGPVFLYIMSILILHEKPHNKILLGIIISLLGVIVIISQPLLEQNLNGHLTGNLFLFLATLAAVGHAVIAKEIVTDYNAATITFWMCLLGSVFFLPFAGYEIITQDFITQIDYRGYLGIIYGIIFSSTIAYTLYEFGIKKIEAQNIGIFSYLDPVAAIFIAIPLLGEKITVLFVLGSILIFSGILIAQGSIIHMPHHRFHKR